MKIFNAFCCAIFAIVLCACGNGTSKKTAHMPMVRIDTVSPIGNIVAKEFPGRVVSSEEANLAFKVSGTISRVHVRAGDYVKAGQLVAELDSSDYKVQLAATEAEYAQIKAEAERVIALYNEQATTASNYDKARYGLRQIQAKLQNHRNQVDYCRIYSPYSGRVKKVYMESRETVGAGMPVGPIASSGIPEVLVNLPASVYLHRESFTSYEAVFNVLPGQVLPMDFVSVMGEANTNQLYTLRLKLRTADTQVAPGMSAWVTIRGEGETTGKVSVPSTSIVEAEGKSCVFVYNPATQCVSKTPVQVHKLHTDGTAEVSGLSEQQTLVVSSGTHFLEDGAKVERLAAPSPTNVGGLL